MEDTMRDRIKSLRRVKAGDLKSHPNNWRNHGAEQIASVQQMLEKVGIADALIAYESGDDLIVIDGHLRKGVDPEQKWPVLILDVTDEEADALLATLDPLAEMADTDQEALHELMEGLQFDGALQKKLNELCGAFDVEPGEMPAISPERETQCQMTFYLTQFQMDIVKEAIKAVPDKTDEENPNSNGNALTRIAESYIEQCEANQG